MNTVDKVKEIYNAVDDKLGIDIKIINISKVSVLADYLIISGANNKSQVQAIVDNVIEKLDQQEVFVRHTEGYSTANWVLLDYGDIIVHVFNQEDRLFYDLERLWQDGNTIEIEELK
ncbi:MAG: ribosome silencing factor [Lachnospiraceae bacterium]|nr:ribosome silencing factor [Lachnospiraceae bacterium]